MTPQPIASTEAIGLCTPHEPEDFQLTIWVYNFEKFNETGISPGFYPDAENSEIERFAPLQLRFSALVSAHSKAPAHSRLADEYRIIGRAIQLIHDTPVINPQLLVGSLADSDAGVNLEIINIGIDELSKIWNSSGKAMVPSFGVKLSSVSISSNRKRQIGKRVGSVNINTLQK
jgi:hypothetical protein